MPPGFTTLFLAGFVGQDMLHDALLYVRPTELHPGAANEIYARRTAELHALIDRQDSAIRSRAQAVTQVVTGRLFGIRRLLQAAAAEFAAVHGDRVLPVVQLVGEIYVRNDAFANDGVIAKLEARGVRVRCAAVNEWFGYTDHCNQQIDPPGKIDRVINFLKERIRHVAWEAMASHLPLPEPVSVADIADAAIDYIAGDVGGETVLTLGWSQLAERRNRGRRQCRPAGVYAHAHCRIAILPRRGTRGPAHADPHIQRRPAGGRCAGQLRVRGPRPSPCWKTGIKQNGRVSRQAENRSARGTL
jgi:hypothetical protein